MLGFIFPDPQENPKKRLNLRSPQHLLRTRMRIFPKLHDQFLDQSQIYPQSCLKTRMRQGIVRKIQLQSLGQYLRQLSMRRKRYQKRLGKKRDNRPLIMALFQELQKARTYVNTRIGTFRPHILTQYLRKLWLQTGLIPLHSLCYWLKYIIKY